MKPKRITYDLDGPGAVERGDVLRTLTGRCHLVVESRRVKSRVSPSRWALRVVPIEKPALEDRVLDLVWAPRGPKRR